MIRKNLLVATSFLLLTSSGWSQVSGEINPSAKILISDHLASAVDQAQLSVALISDGQAQFFGVKNLKDSLHNVENNQILKYEIGSITKVFTSTVLANMAINDNLKLSDKINEVEGLKVKDDLPITFVSLSNHSSGLPPLPTNLGLLSLWSDNPYADYGAEQLEYYLSEELILEDSLIGTYNYSNLGAGLLGHVLSKNSGVSYEKLLELNIFSKYDMRNSSTVLDTNDNTLVKGIGAFGAPASNWSFQSLAGAGAIISTVEDLSKFVMAHFENNDPVLELTRQKTLEVNENMDLGLGWHILSNDSAIHHWHNGGTGGYSSSMAMDTNSKTAVIILSNVSPGNPQMKNLDELCFGLMKELN